MNCSQCPVSKLTIFVQLKDQLFFMKCIFTIFVYIRPFDLYLFSNFIGFKVMLSKLKPQGGEFECQKKCWAIFKDLMEQSEMQLTA